MNKKQLLWGLLFAVGLFMAASYTIDNRGFHSGIYGIIGCALILIAYAGMNWEKTAIKRSTYEKNFSAFEQYFRDYHCP